jgi:hypothetical protein
MKMLKLSLSIALLALIGNINSNCLAQQKTTERIVDVPASSIRPSSGFSVSYDIRSRLNLNEGPVKVIGNENRLEDGPGMSRVEVENSSGKQVKSIKLIWYLFNSLDSTSVVKNGRTKEIKVSNFAPGEKKIVESRLPSFDEMFKGLTKGGYIEGQYFVEVTVGEIKYADGTRWEREDDKNISRVP